MGKQRIVLHHHADAALVGRQIGDVSIADLDAALGRLDEAGDRALAGSTDYLFDVFDVLGVDGLAAGGVLLEEPLAGAVDGLAGGAAEDPVAVSFSFFSPAAAGGFSPSDGGFSLFE